jgi:hypothetical protein
VAQKMPLLFLKLLLVLGFHVQHVARHVNLDVLGIDPGHSVRAVILPSSTEASI